MIYQFIKCNFKILSSSEIIKKFFNSKTIASGAIIISFFSIVSRLLGLLRDRFLSTKFGAGDLLDSYFVAFKIPDLIFHTLILGAFSTCFIPVFLETWQKNKKKAWQITNSCLNIILLVIFVFGSLAFIFAPFFISIIAPGFPLEKIRETIFFTRIILFSILFFGLSTLIGSILQAFQKFLFWSLAPCFYNLGIIFGILFLVPLIGNPGLPLGVIIGSLLHCLIQVPSFLKTGFFYQSRLNLKEISEIVKLILPRIFGIAATQINHLVIIFFGSLITGGSIAVLNLANNIQHFPIGIIGIPLVLASFPLLSNSFIQKDIRKFIEIFSKTFRQILFLIMPLTVLFLLLRAQIVRVILETGNFDWQDTILTANVLGFFSFNLIFESLIPLLTRSFYAQKNTKTPVIIGFFCVLFNISACFVLIKYLEVYGLALAFTLTNFLNLILLFLILRKKMGYLDDWQMLKSFSKIILACLFMVIAIQKAKYFIAHLVDMQTFLGIFLQGFLAGLFGLFIFLLISWLLKSEELKSFNLFFRKT